MDFLLGLLFDALRSLTTTCMVRAYRVLRKPRPFEPPADRVVWLLAALVSFLAAGAIFMLLVLTGCKTKPNSTAAPATSAPAVDTVREQLSRQAQASADTLTTVQKRTQQTESSYESAASRFDSIRVKLP